ncbi:uncharacterized protein PV09_05520 [Verruconis gallopava]|uniref:Nicotianamine synthase n=1 Tax=Verruconis gallopava TaxID=253628 RepID=A0A0D2AVW4_9PEZI|nr:uncharacterized protein PV09_05520 [Verruconis gallopava]KIW03309.1 hypothetical protein PV09_05520 [Verruconis gallopava]
MAPRARRETLYTEDPLIVVKSQDANKHQKLAFDSSGFPSSDLEIDPNRTLAAAVVEKVMALHKKLRMLHSLVPDLKVNQVFNELVSLCLQPFDEDVVDRVLRNDRVKEIVPTLRSICSAGESELECYWSDRIIAKHHKRQTLLGFDEALSAFPYYQNYVDITDVEASLIRSTLPKNVEPEHITFIGSGPLPLTSFMLSKHHFPNAKVTNVDFDIQALAASKKLTYLLGLNSKIDMMHAEASNVPTSVLEGSDVVYLAALVGLSLAEKFTILCSMASKLKYGALLVVRSAHGLRGLLYPVLDVDRLDYDLVDLDLVTEWIPNNSDIVNSVVIFRKREILLQ